MGEGNVDPPPPYPTLSLFLERGGRGLGGGGEVQSYTACPTVNALNLPQSNLQHSHTQIETDSDEG